MRRAALCAALALAALGNPARGADDPAALARAAMARLATANAAHEAAAGRQDRVRALTETVRAYEEGLTALRAGLRQVAREEAGLSAALEARSGEISRLLGALAGIESTPPELALLHPAGPVGAARAAMVLGVATAALEAEAAALRAELDEIRALREVQRGAEQTLTEALSGVQEARAALSAAIGARTDLPRRFTADPERMRELVEAADTLDAFAAGLAAMEGSGAATGGAELDGGLALPVEGVVLRRFGEADAAGVARPGTLVATRPGALVTAPFGATVRYAGPLLDYGNVMILEPEAGTLLVLSGLGPLYAAPGQIVSAGEALGLMGGLPADAASGPGAAQPDAADAERTETLYIEARRGETPVDPAGWFAIERQE